jgi:HSP20 family protein
VLQSEMNRLFDTFVGAGGFFPAFRGNQDAALGRWPTLDVSMDAERVHVECDLPGIDPKAVQVTVDANQIVLSGETRSEHEEKGRRFTRRERTRGSFERSIPLPPDVVPDKAQARFQNGVLLIDVPRQVDERSLPRRVPIAES